MELIYFATSVFILFVIILANSMHLTKKYENMENPSMVNPSNDNSDVVDTYDKLSVSANSYDVKFHDDIEDIKKQSNVYTFNTETVKSKDPNGKPVDIKISTTLGSATYYKPDTYKYGSPSYIPSYEDTVYLSYIKNYKPPVTTSPPTTTTYAPRTTTTYGPMTTTYSSTTTYPRVIQEPTEYNAVQYTPLFYDPKKQLLPAFDEKILMTQPEKIFDETTNFLN